MWPRISPTRRGPRPAVSTATAVSVYVQWAGPAGSGIISDPAYATVNIGGAFIEADLAPGIFKGTAFANGVPMIVSGTSAYSGIDTLVFTNTGAAPATIGGLDPFDVTLDATFAHTSSSDGGWSTELIASPTEVVSWRLADVSTRSSSATST